MSPTTPSTEVITGVGLIKAADQAAWVTLYPNSARQIQTIPPFQDTPPFHEMEDRGMQLSKFMAGSKFTVEEPKGVCSMTWSAPETEK